MKKIISAVLFTLIAYGAFTQPKGAREKLLKMPDRVITANGFEPPKKIKISNVKENINNFLLFYIPSAITGEGMEPGGISHLNLDFGDDKVKFKWGLSMKKDASKYLKNSFGISASAAAPSGVRTLFQYDNTPNDIELGFTYTNILNEISYTYGGTPSAEEAYWLNCNLSYTRNKIFLFSDDTTYSKVVNNNFSILVSINHYFNSWFRQRSIYLRNIWNFSIGVGHFSNYDALDDITLREGNIAGSYFSEKGTVVGKSGNYSRDLGLLARGSFFYPISSPTKNIYIMLGVNANTFGLGSKHFTANSNGGIYVSKRKYDEDEKMLTDIFSFGILADYSAMEKWGTKDYAKDNFRVIFVSQIPLRWR